MKMRKAVLFTSILSLISISASSQKVGIGTTSPIARLEVKGEGSTSMTNTFVLKNSSNDTLLRVRNDGKMSIGYNGTSLGRTLNLGGTGLNIYGNGDIFSGAIHPTDTSLVIWSEVGANHYVILQPQWGKVGIGTYFPRAKLHVRDGSSGNVPVSTAVLVVESDSNSVINLLTPNAYSSGIQFGNGAFSAHSSILYNHSSVSNGLSLRTNGITRMVVAENGNVGIGQVNPQKKLHVSGGSTGVTATSSAVAVFESNFDVSINLITPNAESSAIHFGNATSSIHGGIVYNPSTVLNGLAFRTNGNNTRMVIAGSGNVGVGTLAPGYRLHVVSTNSNDGGWSQGVVIENTATTGEAAVSFINTTIPSGRQWNIGLNQSPILAFNYGGAFAGSSTKMAIDTLGNTGIGTITPLQKLHVVGNGFFEGVVIASCGILSCSDIRYKNRLSPLTNTLTSLMSLHGIYYYWDKEKFTDKAFNDTRQIGFSAQEVELVFPEMVYTDASGYKMVDYSRLTPVLVEAIKEQQYIIESQQLQLEAQALKLESFEKELRELKSLVLQMRSTQ